MGYWGIRNKPSLSEHRGQGLSCPSKLTCFTRLNLYSLAELATASWGSGPDLEDIAGGWFEAGHYSLGFLGLQSGITLHLLVLETKKSTKQSRNKKPPVPPTSHEHTWQWRKWHQPACQSRSTGPEFPNTEKPILPSKVSIWSHTSRLWIYWWNFFTESNTLVGN